MSRLSPLFKLALLCAAFVAVVLAVWLIFVPAAISPATFGWITAAALLAIVVTAASAANARATRSIAHVLYDVENPAERRP